MRNLLLISSSRVHGCQYMEAAEEQIKDFLKSSFLELAGLQFKPSLYEEDGFNIKGIHQHEDPVLAVNKAEAIFVGGGNTFLLLKTLYDQNLVKAINKRVLEDGTLYMGSSAGTNVATKSINTTNDMPIVYPPSFSALNLVPFNINPHYIEADANTSHMGETRDQRINEYLEMEDSGPVLGLREGCMLRVTGNRAELKGIMGAKLFTPGKEPKEYEINSDVSFLLNEQ